MAIGSMIYIDKPVLHGRVRWAHLWDSENNARRLQRFAQKMGLKRTWFQDRPGFPHYDLYGWKIKWAKEDGAVVMSLKDWLRARDAEEQKREGCKS